MILTIGRLWAQMAGPIGMCCRIFRAVETYAGDPSQFRGAHGPLQISDLRNDNPACNDWLRAARAHGLPQNSDFNGESSYGVGGYQLTPSRSVAR